MRIAVVIPYFQREPGILRRALTSALNQVGVTPPIVVIGNDSSPVPPEGEIAALPEALRAQVMVATQKNSGPGAARNLALESLPADIEAVAFLDSDDEWSPTHLANATAALQSGIDLYFADHYPLGWPDTKFDRAQLKVNDHRQLHPGVPVYEYNGDLLKHLLKNCPIGTSTVVYRLQRHDQLRFRTDLKHSGEDLLFWIDLWRRQQRAAFSTDIECRYGKGVNIYQGTSWGSASDLNRIVDDICCFSLIGSTVPLTPAQQEVLDSRRRSFRPQWVRALLHRLRKGPPIPARLVAGAIAADKGLIAAFLTESTSAAYDKICAKTKAR